MVALVNAVTASADDVITSNHTAARARLCSGVPGTGCTTGVGVGLGVAVGVGVSVGLGVCVGDGVTVGVAVGVQVGRSTTSNVSSFCHTCSLTQRHPGRSSGGYAGPL